MNKDKKFQTVRMKLIKESIQKIELNEIGPLVPLVLGAGRVAAGLVLRGAAARGAAKLAPRLLRKVPSIGKNTKPLPPPPPRVPPKTPGVPAPPTIGRRLEKIGKAGKEILLWNMAFGGQSQQEDQPGGKGTTSMPYSDDSGASGLETSQKGPDRAQRRVRHVHHQRGPHSPTHLDME